MAKKQIVVEYGHPDAGLYAKATFHRQTGRDQLERDRLMRKLRDADPAIALTGDPDADVPLFHHAMRWAEIVVQLDDLESVGFTYRLPTAADAPQQVLEAFWAWKDLDGPMQWEMQRALGELNAPPGHRDLAPPRFLSEEERADPKSGSAV